MTILKENGSTLADNRKAFYNYEIIESLEVGLILTGSEVKSLRLGKISLVEAHAAEKNGELLLFNCTIPEYPGSNRFNHEPKRPRKILIKTRERVRFINSVQKKGLTLIPLLLYFNDKGLVKLKLALAKGKNVADKRQTIKDRDWSREKQRLMKTKDHD